MPHSVTTIRARWLKGHSDVLYVLPKGAILIRVAGGFVVCPGQGYVNALRNRARALAASGNPNYRKCKYCHRWDSPQHLIISENAWHRACAIEYQATYRAAHPKRRQVNKRHGWHQGR